MEDDTDPTTRPESLLPYDAWAEEALRQVVVRALAHVAAEGMPGDHHFYISFRTDRPGVTMPPRLRAQYPQEMTIVLQHQFWDLKADEADGAFQVALSFSGVSSLLIVPFSAVTAFADPHVQFGLRFHVPEEQPANDPEPEPETPAAAMAAPDATPQVVSLDAFRRKAPNKE